MAKRVVIYLKDLSKDGAPKKWVFPYINQVDITDDRLQLKREGHGLVFDVPKEDVEHFYEEEE
jgi:hypothetical protein